MSLAIQGSPEWHAARAGKIKASVCAAFEGKHPYMKPEDLVRQEVRALAGAESEFKMVPCRCSRTDDGRFTLVSF